MSIKARLIAVLAIILAVFYASMAIFALRAGGIIFLPYPGTAMSSNRMMVLPPSVPAGLMLWLRRGR